MLNKLAFRNVKRSIKDYSIYLITVTFALALIYAFNLLAFSDDIGELAGSMNILTMIIIFISCIVVFVIGWLVYYMTRFMIEKRSREFGTYMVLGIPNKSIGRMFQVEHTLMGCIAFFGGFLVGNLLYQFLAIIIMKIFNAAYQVHVVFSLPALLLTLLYTVLIYAFSMQRTKRRLKKMKIYDLLYADKKNENGDLSNKKSHFVLFFLSLIVEICGCVLARYVSYHIEVKNSGTLFLMGMFLIILGIYGIYLTLTAFIAKMALRKEEYKYQKNRMFLFRNLSAKLHTIGITLGTLALLITMTLTCTQMGILFKEFFDEQIRLTASFDIALAGENQDNEFQQVLDYAKENCGISDYLDYQVMVNSSTVYDMIHQNYGGGTYMEKDPVLSYSNYKALREMLNYEPVELDPEKYLIQAMPTVAKKIHSLEMPAFTIDGTPLSLQECREEPFGVSGGPNGLEYVVVVPDELAEKLPLYQKALVIETVKETTEKDNIQLNELLFHFNPSVMSSVSNDSISLLLVKGGIAASQRSAFTILSFSLFYVGLVFVCVAATILAVQQLSEASKYRFRYDILSNLGMSGNEMKKLIFKQILIYFGIPLVLPVPLSILLSYWINHLLMMDLITGQVFWLSQCLSLGLFLLVYAMYFMVTYISYRRSILRQ